MVNADDLIEFVPGPRFLRVDFLNHELEILTAGRIREPLLKKMEEKTEHVVLNLSKVEYIDSAGLGLIATVNNLIIARNGRLSVAALKPQVAQVFRHTQMERVIRVFRDVDSVV